MCARARFTEFRGERLATDRASLAAGKHTAESHCGSCHLTPLPESMSQNNAAYMLAYMGLFLGIDASRQLDEAEKAHFKQRYALLKSTQAIPLAPQLTPGAWQALRSYYLSSARYHFVSSEKAAPLAQTPVAFADQGVTLIKNLRDGGMVVGGGVTGALYVFDRGLTLKKTIALDSPAVHLEESSSNWYVLTLGSLLGALGAESQSSLYRIDAQNYSLKRIATGLPRAAHFIMADTNADRVTDFVVAGFGSVSGGGVVLVESFGNSFRQTVLSRSESIVRLGKIAENGRNLEFLALAAGAREAILHIRFENGKAHERVLETFAPHLGAVGLEFADLDGDGQNELLVLSGDNADSGPYNEAKPDQGLRIYSFKDQNLKQIHFESLPGALTMHVSQNEDLPRIAVARYYTDPLARQDLTLLTQRSAFKFERSHFTLESRPTVIAAFGDKTDPAYLVGSGNFPILALHDDKPIKRDFSGPVLSVVRPKLAKN